MGTFLFCTAMRNNGATLILGNSRLQRGLNYAYYLKHVSGTR